MLLKNDQQTTHVLNATKRKLMNLAYGAECLSMKIDNWISSNNNYRRLKTSKFSRSCLTMTDRPALSTETSRWSYEDTVLLENWMAEKPDIPPRINNNATTVENPTYNEEYDSESPYLNEPVVNINSSKNYKESIINPTIKMDGDYIQVEYYRENNDDNVNDKSIDGGYTVEENAQDLYNVNGNRMKDTTANVNVPKIPQNKIADRRGLSPQYCKKYKDFLIKYEDSNNETNIVTETKHQIVNERTREESVPDPNGHNHFDKHRPLTQSTNKQNHEINQQSTVIFQRVGSTKFNKSDNDEFKTELKSFLSFRCPNRLNRSDKKIRKKYVTSEDGATGPIWPAVLLTYDRKIATGRTEHNANELKMACSIITAVSVAISIYLLLPQYLVLTVSASSPSSEMISSNDAQSINHGIGNRHRALPMLLSSRSGGNSQFIRARLTPIEPLISDVVIDDTDDLVDVNKRQFDDYGHMRFGKRGEIEEKFDDYGHMRFGRGHV